MGPGHRFPAIIAGTDSVCRFNYPGPVTFSFQEGFHLPGADRPGNKLQELSSNACEIISPAENLDIMKESGKFNIFNMDIHHHSPLFHTSMFPRPKTTFFPAENLSMKSSTIISQEEKSPHRTTEPVAPPSCIEPFCLAE